ncbi:MAG TPA: FtsQ-type POTRA domain-containing protein [Desulfotignum sp.]|nr:FtsQ-type POTRA domain-containing protein [Desulfotignum sp.]
MNEKTRQNQYKKHPDSPGFMKTKRQQFFKTTALPVLVCVLSIAAVFAHDVVVQSPLFTIKKVAVSGENRVTKNEILALAGLDAPANFFGVNRFAMEKKIAAHPWIAAAAVRRTLFFSLEVSIVEEDPLAIVSIENLSDILINTQGKPFKAYDPDQDKALQLPVITGVDLTRSNDQYLFQGPLFNSILDLLHKQIPHTIVSVKGDQDMGITIQVPDVFNQAPMTDNHLIPLHLGFDDYRKKLIKARKISQYITANIPGITICAMDLFDMDTVFVKTADMDTLPGNQEKGV